MRAKYTCMFGLLILVFAITVGCGDDNDNPVAPQIGAITINPEPNSISAPWQITGPNNFTLSASGDTTLAGVVAGSYTLTWESVDGWMTPTPVAETQTLTLDGVVTFAGQYCPGCYVSVPSGTFTMGSPTTEPLRFTNETEHQVTLTHGIYVQTTEVTNLQYMELAQWAYDNGYVTATSASLTDNLDGSTQILKTLGEGNYEMSFSAGVFSCTNPTHPVKYVSWYGSVAYCDWLSLQRGLPRAYNHSTWQCNGGDPYAATGYRLPTEAEWEYACRAGTQTPFSSGSCLAAGVEANYDGRLPYTGCAVESFVGYSVPVGSYSANVFGLYDMHGNEWEWSNDWYGDYVGAVTDPVGPGTGSNRVIRGGYWFADARGCRSAYRGNTDPSGALLTVGFRTVRSAD